MTSKNIVVIEQRSSCDCNRVQVGYFLLQLWRMHTPLSSLVCCRQRNRRQQILRDVTRDQGTRLSGSETWHSLGFPLRVQQYYGEQHLQVCLELCKPSEQQCQPPQPLNTSRLIKRHNVTMPWFSISLNTTNDPSFAYQTQPSHPPPTIHKSPRGQTRLKQPPTSLYTHPQFNSRQHPYTLNIKPAHIASKYKGGVFVD